MVRPFPTSMFENVAFGGRHQGPSRAAALGTVDTMSSRSTQTPESSKKRGQKVEADSSKNVFVVSDGRSRSAIQALA